MPVKLIDIGASGDYRRIEKNEGFTIYCFWNGQEKLLWFKKKRF